MKARLILLWVVLVFTAGLGVVEAPGSSLTTLGTSSIKIRVGMPTFPALEALAVALIVAETAQGESNGY
jgi:hypothetical protein